MYAHDLKCPTSITKPREVGICDRCSEKRFLSELVWQWDVRGLGLKNLRIRVCYDRCLDTPAWFLKPVVIGPDPVPPQDPRPYNYGVQESGGTTPPTDLQTFIFGD
jgi:hypothetical protein